MENTPSHKRVQNYKDNNDLKLNSLSTPIEVNKYYDKLFNSKYNENDTQKYKTIAQLRKNNNINNTNDSIPKPQNLFNNTAEYDSFKKTKTDPYNDKNIKEDYKTKSLQKNRKNEISQNKNEIFLSKSSNNMPKIKKKIEADDILGSINNNKANENFADDEDSENLSKLAEDLLSISDEHKVQQMRREPINKNDFIGESKEFFNIYSKINKLYQFERNEKNDTTEKKVNKTDINMLNNEINNQIPKMQTQLYISPLDKLNLQNIKNSNKIKSFNKINNHLNYNINTDFNNYNINSREAGIDLKKFSKIKYHISSNSIINNSNNINSKINNYPLLNHMNMSNQLMNNSNYNNNNLNQTNLNEYQNIMNLNEEINKSLVNLNNSNIKSNKSSNKKNKNYTNTDNIIKNNPKSYRNNNNHSIGKNVNISNAGNNSIKKNISNYNAYNHKQTLNNNYNNIKNKINNEYNLNNIKNINTINNNLNKNINFNKSKNINYINNVNKNLKKINDKRMQMENVNYNRIINNNRYESKIEKNMELINKNMNNINYNYNFNNNYSYEPLNKGNQNVIKTNKSVTKNERSSRKNFINIPKQNFLRTSDFHKMVDFPNFNERDGNISMSTAMNKVIERNSLQSKSQTKKPYNEISSMINSFSHIPLNNHINYRNINNNKINMGNNLQNKPIEKNNEKIIKRIVQAKKVNLLLNQNLNNYQNRYRNINTNTYQGKNEKVNLNLINDYNFNDNTLIEIPTF